MVYSFLMLKLNPGLAGNPLLEAIVRKTGFPSPGS
jgi:hypothetical protein